MAPTRPLKRQKTNDGEKALPPPIPSEVPLPPATPELQSQQPEAPASDNSFSPWYRTWPRKATSIAQVNSENAITDDAVSETVSVPTERRPARRSSARSPSLAMTLGKTTSNRSLPIDATTSKVHAIPEPSKRSSASSRALQNDQRDNHIKSKEVSAQIEQKDGSKRTPEDDPKPTEQPPQQQQTSAASKSVRGSGWFGWTSKGQDTIEGNPEETATASTPDNIHETSTIPTLAVAEPNDTSPPTSKNKRTWLQMWTGDGPLEHPGGPEGEAGAKDAHAQSNVSGGLQIPNTPKANTPSQASSLETSPPPPLSGDGNKSSGWVFWSRDRRNNLSKSSIENQPHVGEIAISGEASQTRPKRASISLKKDEPRPVVENKPETPGDQKKSDLKDASRPGTPKPGKRGKPAMVESAHAAATIAQTPVELDSSRTASPAPSLKRGQNLLLPGLHDTLQFTDNPSLLQQLSRLLYYTKEPELKHLSLVRDPPRIQNALAIGVHGYFPGPMVRTLIGQPTGTSIKFAELAAKSIRKWTNSRGYDCQVKTAALEGEGRIAERVELLWKLLLNWIDEIRKTDFLLVACHSQGVPVAIMLVAKLIQFGCVNAARVGVCAMAGVSLGPFPEFRSRWISGSAGELFEFSDPNSKVSQDYQNALEVVLKAGVRLSLIGSIDDQLVSLESSIFAPISHPHIFRAVLVDSRVHAPNFLSHLVGFILKLRNLGIQDHGLIRELSSPLAGSLYTGEGHSRIYDDDAVYDLAVSFALETNASLDTPLIRNQISATVANPYILPFAMRGILEEELVKTQLHEEAQQLLRQFDDWQPTTKALKDVKFRLEGVRSKL